MNRLLIKRLLFPLLVAASIVIPSITGSTTFAMTSMDSMEHSKIDTATCINQHQVPVAPGPTQQNENGKNNDGDPTPPELQYFWTSGNQFDVPAKPKPGLIFSSSFCPPDIIILTANLRL